MRRITISLIVPTFNRAHTLRRALDSVYAQTLQPDEVLVVDDGSSDGTEELVRSEYPQAQYLRQPNAGVSSARNRGIRAAQGDWIALLDSDDAWLPQKLARQVAVIAADPALSIVHTDEIWIRRGVRVNPMKKHKKPDGAIFAQCLPFCVMSPSSVLIRKQVLFDVGLFDESLPACEDYDLWLKLCSRLPVRLVDDALVVKYGGHPDQLSRRYWGMDRFRVQALENLLASGLLDQAQQRMVVETLVEKCRILAQGAKKRGKDEFCAHYMQKIDRYRFGTGMGGKGYARI